ncbi:MAG: hypothetical protein NTW14_07440 [bacterium]|nr:hypothetical protein [bacterium]
MRKTPWIATVLLLAVTAWAQAPNFDYPYLMRNASGFIVNGNAYDCPCFGDWDDDGSIDMMVGVFYDGNIHYYHNSAPAGSEPVFENFVLVYSDGSPISVSYG